jgi:hypothetical protein
LNFTKVDRVEYTHGRFAAMKSRSGTLTEAREFRLSDALLDRLARARSVLVLTGAGMSADLVQIQAGGTGNAGSVRR